MHKRKRSRKFNAVVIKKTSVMIMILFVLIVSILLLLIGQKSDFSKEQLERVIAGELPMISQSSKTFDRVKNEFLNVMNSEAVLAETLPMIDMFFSDTGAADDKESKAQSPALLSQSEDIPKNTFPIKSSQVISKNLEIRNETTYAPDINSLLYAPLSFKAPEILIVHTHATESYKMDDLGYYSEGDSDRTTDTQFNVVRVGEELAKELTGYGFKVTHAKDINDYPSYNQSYNKTLEVINYYLRNNSNIQIVLDIHRDSIVKSDGSKLKFTSTINNESVAQVMIVCGTNQAGLDNDTWQENLKFALKMQNYMETNYPGLARPLNLRQERFNTHATLGSMIIEVGTSGNTLQEALVSTKYLSKTIKEILKPYR